MSLAGGGVKGPFVARPSVPPVLLGKRWTPLSRKQDSPGQGDGTPGPWRHSRRGTAPTKAMDKRGPWFSRGPPPAGFIAESKVEGAGPAKLGLLMGNSDSPSVYRPVGKRGGPERASPGT